MYCFKLGSMRSIRFDKIRWLWQQDIVNKDVWLAGGSLRTIVDQNETIVDYDLFFKRQEKDIEGSKYNKVPETRDKLEKLGFKLTFECPEGKMYSYEREYCTICGRTKELDSLCKPNSIYQKVQLICEHFYNSPEELLSTFDLTPCIFATDGEFLWAYKSAIKGVRTKQVRLNKLTYPIATMKRIIKYGKKGYNTNLACKDFVILVGNLMGVDTISLSEDQLRQYID